ncbi:MAG: hypothetical protein V4539_06650 [Bacteroidota bacterium]
MLLITHKKGNGRCLAFLISERIYDCRDIHPGLPETEEAFLAEWEKYKSLAQLMHNALQTNSIKRELEHIEIGAAEDVQAVVLPGVQADKI